MTASSTWAPRSAVIVRHTGRVTKHPIALLVLSAVADPEAHLGQQQIVVENNVLAAFARQMRASIQRDIAHKMIGLPRQNTSRSGSTRVCSGDRSYSLVEIKVGVHQRCNMIGDIYNQANRALFGVGPKGERALEKYLGRVVVEMLPHIKHVLTKSGQIYRP